MVTRRGETLQTGVMEPDNLVSVVIPCYNPKPFLKEAVDSVLAQTHRPLEIIMVNDGSDRPDSLQLLNSLNDRVTRRIDQANLGPGAARNAGFRAAQGKYIVPLDADDRLEPAFIAECLAALQCRDAAFVYSDYRVFGDMNYTERLEDYNLYRLLDRNIITYAAVIRKSDWELVGGYDESLQVHYEDWEFWLRLAERERFGYHHPKVLFQYRKSGPSQFTLAAARNEQLEAAIRASHPRLYSREGRARVKARWAPSVCIVGPPPANAPLIDDWDHVPAINPSDALKQSPADAFLVPPSGASGDHHTAELCALAVWGGKAVMNLPDGALCASRRALSSVRGFTELSGRPGIEDARPPARPLGSGRWRQLHRHLVNAELTSLDNWLRNPLRSLSRLIPLHFKEDINRAAGRPIFDLSFYLRFQMTSALVADSVVPLLRYMPPPAQRSRIALMGPHLGPGGAESVLLELAGAIDRRKHEVFLLATQSREAQWLPKWQQAVDHVYDLAPLIPPERMVAGLCSIGANWEFDALVIQNSLAAYSAIPHLRKERPNLKVIDIIHAVDPAWDFVKASAPVATQIDLRVAISEAGRQRLLQAGVPHDQLRLIRNGIDLGRYRPEAQRPPEATKTILFAGRLDPVKRPLLLVDIASELAKLRGGPDFRVLVAGDGPENESLRLRIHRAGLDSVFQLLGQVSDVPALLASADVLVLPSQEEGIPLIVLEAFAVARPVVSSRVGAVEEVVDSSNGILIETGHGEEQRFAGALHQLFNNPAGRERMGRAGRKTVEEQYDQRKSREAYRDLLGGLLNRPKAD